MRYVTLTLNCLLAIFCVVGMILILIWNKKPGFNYLMLVGLVPMFSMAFLGIARYLSKNAVIAILNTVLGCAVLLFGIFLVFFIFPLEVEGQSDPKAEPLWVAFFLIATATANIFGHRHQA